MFAIAVILIAGFDHMGRDYDATLNKVLRICRQANLKLNKDKCLFWSIGIPFFGEVMIIEWHTSGGIDKDKNIIKQGACMKY